MDDLISRADAIEAVVSWTVEDRPTEVMPTDLVDRIKALPSAELPAEAEFTDLPDIPRYYYEKVVGNMAHEINMLKEQLESAEAVQGEWKCMADCGVTECDQCGWSIEEYVGDYNYCPNCGARMKGGNE